MISTIGSQVGAPMDMDKPHYFVFTLKLVFCDLKSKFPYNLKIIYQQVNTKGRSFN
jgi:hypothetical protein